MADILKSLKKEYILIPGERFCEHQPDEVRCANIEKYNLELIVCWIPQGEKFTIRNHGGDYPFEYIIRETQLNLTA